MGSVLLVLRQLPILVFPGNIAWYLHARPGAAIFRFRLVLVFHVNLQDLWLKTLLISDYVKDIVKPLNDPLEDPADAKIL